MARKNVMVTIDISLEDIGVISALLDHYKNGERIQRNWDDLYKNTHSMIFGTYGVRRITIPRRYH